MWSYILRFGIEVAAAVVIALLLRRYVCMLVYVRGHSMRDTLHNKDLFFAVRTSLARDLRRYDVVVCRYPAQKGLRVKRIVALPGECIELREGELYIDGEQQRQCFPQRKALRNMPERIVPEGAYFLLGDNRAASRDSRTVGAIERDEIIAVAKWVVLPFKHRRSLRARS